MSENAQERTESATPRRREEARNEGRIARSVELSTAVLLLTGAGALSMLCGQSIAHYATRLLRESVRSLSAGGLSPGGAVLMIRDAAGGFILAILPFAVILISATVLVNLLQTQGLVTSKPLEPKWSNVDPLSGVRRILSLDALFNLGKSILKLVVLAIVTWIVIRKSWPELVSLAEAGPIEIAAVLKLVVVRLAMMAGISFLGVALIDYGFQRFQMERRLRMTRQEIILEQRESEGDPNVKSRLRSMAQANARRRMLQKVPMADVVIVNPTEIAVALRYDTSVAPAPVVVAMGQRKLAERIKKIALAANVPVVENRPVARALLATAKIGHAIPPALYAAVAEILAFIYRKHGRLRGMTHDALLPGRVS
jgi:flagellar biosynthetic protein FlhB